MNRVFHVSEEKADEVAEPYCQSLEHNLRLWRAHMQAYLKRVEGGGKGQEKEEKDKEEEKEEKEDERPSFYSPETLVCLHFSFSRCVVVLS